MFCRLLYHRQKNDINAKFVIQRKKCTLILDVELIINEGLHWVLKTREFKRSENVMLNCKKK